MRKCDLQEERIARLASGKRTPGSGNTEFIKGDVRAGSFLFEAKYRSSSNGKGSYIDVQLEWLIVLLREAKEAGKVPVLVVDIGDKNTHYLRWDPLDKSYDIDASASKCFRMSQHDEINDLRIRFGSEVGVWICTDEETFFNMNSFFPMEPVEESQESIAYKANKKLKQREYNAKQRARQKEARQLKKQNLKNKSG